MKNLISKKDLIKILSKSLNISEKKINEKTNSKNTKEWDSLNHLNILIAINKKTSKKAEKLQELSNAYSLKKISQILKKNNLLK